MKIIQLVCADGLLRMGPSAPVPDDFDVQAWANERRVSLHMLGVVKVVEQFLEPAVSKIKYGDKVWFRGRFAKEFSLRGVIEEIENIEAVDPDAGVIYGVRLENGNFFWANAGQITPRDEEKAPGTQEPGEDGC